MNHLSRWYYVTEAFSLPIKVDYIVDHVTIAVTRYRYDNLYSVLGEIYNTYLIMKFLNVSADDVMILLVDAHPVHQLDSLWSYLFHFTMDLSNMNTLTHIKTLVWSPIEHDSHFFSQDLNRLGYIEEYRKFVLDRYGLSDKKVLNCNKITVLVIWRRDRVGHDGKIIKHIRHKIDNEQDLWFSLMENFPTDQINGSQIDQLQIRNQLHHVTNTDILIGLHGSGLAHSLFLPSHAGVVEIFPAYFGQISKEYSAICRWRNLKYKRWVNDNPSNESKIKESLKVDLTAVIDKVRKIRNAMCPPNYFK